MKKVLITGGAGFVGRHFTHRLLRMGHEVHCVDLVAPHTGGIHPGEGDGWPLFDPRGYDNFKFYHQDCRQFFRERSDTDFDYVFHLAAMVGGRVMIETNPLAVADDLGIDSEYWQWARKVKPVKTINFSSSAAYPVKFQRREGYILLKEDMIEFENDIGMPDMSYGWAKLTCEYLARLAYEKHGLNSVTYRPFSGYGEDQDMSYPFPGICKRVMENKNQPLINVWGTGEQMRDFIHIGDCVESVISSMDQIGDGSALNLSTGIYTSFKEFALIAAEVLGFHPEVKGTSNTPEGVFARGGDTTKQKAFGLSYTLSFRQGIERMMAYLEEKR
jgi:nucleoside-diphosphate-sugar epimerase